MASAQIGRFFVMAGLPRITGYLACGLIAGPSVLSLFEMKDILEVKGIDGAALAFIGLIAGSELYWKGLKPLIGKVAWVACCVMSVTFTVMACSFYYFVSRSSSLSVFPASQLAAMACIAGTIFVARSPSSAIAVVNEVKAAGPFTQMSLGVTVVLDIVVIVLFSAVDLLTRPVLMNQPFQFIYIFKVVGETLTSIGFGVGFGWFASRLFRSGLSGFFLGCSWFVGGVFCYKFGSYLASAFNWHVENTVVFLTSGFYLTNFCTSHRFLKSFTSATTPVVFIAFFTLTGASLDIRLFEAIWPITLALFFIRMGAIYLGAKIGVTIANLDPRHRKYQWMSFITQAGVGLGLAKKISDAYPEWGSAFATVIISVIIMNEILGPPLFKHALKSVEEGSNRAKKSEKSAKPRVFVFGSGQNAEALSRQLSAHDWKVTFVHQKSYSAQFEADNFSTLEFEQINKTYLEELPTEDEFTFVLMLSDQVNRDVCKLLIEKHPDAHIIVSISNLESRQWFEGMNISLVDTHTAFISLLDHYVRTPSAVSLLMGYEQDTEVVECTLSNSFFVGKGLRDLDLAAGVLVLAVRRSGKELHFHEQLKLQTGDRLTLIGSKDSLEEVEYRFSTNFV